MNHHKIKMSHVLILTIFMIALVNLTTSQAHAGSEYKSCQSTTVNDGGGDEGGKSGGGKH